MATILRPPLVSNPQRKRPLAPLDLPPRSLALTTIVAATLPTGKQWSESAPRAKPWLGISQPLQGFIVDNGPEAAIASLSASAPQRKSRLSVEQYTNLLTTTLGVTAPYTLPLSAEQTFDDSAPRRKAQVFDLGLTRPLTLGINPNAVIAQLSESAPPRKVQVQSFDFPNLATTTLAPAAAALALPLNAGRIDASAPRLRRVQVDGYPNLSLTTLAPILTPLALPLLAMRWDWSAPPPKRPVRIDQPLHRAVWRDAIPKVSQLGSVEQRKRATVFEHPPNRLTLTVTFVAIPDVVGQTQATGTTTLNDAGFVVEIETAFSDTLAAGNIISESPIAGTLAATGSTVTITVSLGALTTPRRRRVIIANTDRSTQVMRTDRSTQVIRRRRNTLQ